MYFSGVKRRMKQFFSWIANYLGITFLTREETISFLLPYQQGFHPANRLPLSNVVNNANDTETIFEAKLAEGEPSYTWVYPSVERKATLLRCGNILTDGRVLCADYDNQHLLKDSFRGNKRRTYEANTLIAPFGQYLDGIYYGGYYDYLFLVAAKLCRIEQDSLNILFTDSVVSYPLFDTLYEREFLYYLGFTPDRILDSRHYNVRFDTCLLGNNGNWFYPNAADVNVLRQRLFPLIQNQTAKRERLYISRSGRRRIANEDELVKLLQNYDFTIVEDNPRSLSEQLSLYHKASFIIGPHGASFSNIIWCQPGTHLFELFSPNYAPDHFQYLARLTGLSYSAYWHGKKLYKSAWPESLSEDMTISVSEIERSLNEHFEALHLKAAL